MVRSNILPQKSCDASAGARKSCLVRRTRAQSPACPADREDVASLVHERYDFAAETAVAIGVVGDLVVSRR